METTKEPEYDIPTGRLEEVNIGDQMVVLAKKGRDGRPIGRLVDGRVILFAKDTPFEIDVGDTILGAVAFAGPTYIIITPESVLGDGDEALITNLKNVALSGYYQHAILAKAMLRILEILM